MQTYKFDFPIFANNPWLVFLDSGASAQKPNYVIEKTSEFTAKYYANIHRGSYQLSEQSEEIYHKSKSKLASFLSAKNQSADSSEIFYSYNTTLTTRYTRYDVYGGTCPRLAKIWDWSLFR